MHSRPQSHLALLTGETWARGPEGSGDTGLEKFEILGLLMASICSSRSVYVSKCRCCKPFNTQSSFRNQLTLREEQIDALRCPRISDVLILWRQSPLVLVPRLHRLRGPGGSGEEDAAYVESYS